MPRIDISETIRRIDFPPEVWEWLDLFGDILAATEREAMHQEKTFLADTPFKKMLLCTINKDLSTLNTIYILLRCELTLTLHKNSEIDRKKIWCQATVIRYCIVHNLLKVHGYSPEFA